MSDYVAGKRWKQEKYQQILEVGFRLFSQRGIELVTMPEVAEASGIARATLFRYFPSKLDLAVAIGSWKWEEFIESYNAAVPAETMARMTGADYLRFILDSFVELYRNRSDILLFNYKFNNFLRHEAGRQEKTQPYLRIIEKLEAQFHEMYARGRADGTLNGEISERSMFSFSFHIMLAAVTRYAVGLVVVYEGVSDPLSELMLLEEMLLERFCRQGDGEAEKRKIDPRTAGSVLLFV